MYILYRSSMFVRIFTLLDSANILSLEYSANGWRKRAGKRARAILYTIQYDFESLRLTNYLMNLSNIWYRINTISRIVCSKHSSRLLLELCSPHCAQRFTQFGLILLTARICTQYKGGNCKMQNALVQYLIQSLCTV